MISGDDLRPAAIALAVGLAGLSTGCELPDIPQFNGEPVDIEQPDDFELIGDPQAGEQTYDRRCATCHGEEGQGDGPTAVGMDPPPTDFTAAPLDPWRAYAVTRDGGRPHGLSAGMPAFRRALDEQQLHDVVAYSMAFYDDEDPVEQDDPVDQEPEPDEESEAEAAGESGGE